MVDTIGMQVLDVLGRQPQQALFVTELVARMGPGAPAGPDLDHLLNALDGDGALVVHHASPDPHLGGDLRVVALAGQRAAVNAERVWVAWLRDVLTAHRCC